LWVIIIGVIAGVCGILCLAVITVIDFIAATGELSLVISAGVAEQVPDKYEGRGG
jgi:hypothetical protein